MEVELVAHTPDPAWVVEQAASVCYDSTPTRECKLVMQCYRSGHHSVLEHASFTFKISGISRACSHQLVRRRMASYSQRSQRYCDEDGFGYVTPPSIELSSYHDSIENALDEYVHLKNSMGRPAEDARYVLPNACVTAIYVTMNLVVDVMPQADEMLRPKCEAHVDYPFCPEHKSCGRHLTLKGVYKTE